MDTQDLRANPDKVYVFGDNVERRGYGGQAKEMRGEPNAIGVVTKWTPSMDPKAFFDDTAACRMLVERDLLLVQQALDSARTVVVPADGIGTGLSRLPRHAPNLDAFIKQWFNSRANKTWDEFEAIPRSTR
ncbi:hypothetical protein M2222_001357 [Bradyrhizobium elkanii]|uniref:DUF7831 domain-containing protein n=1 Tax=Bradyrhizobium elkanii TaxID=29448 RepID=UPI0021698E79|nr:hypothetical protein [Bradyrhizobium elkanii]MCS3449822.1 hypothetical protein [Bradyrhizobium elkanii]MCS3559035.1 hypothetical protein [Bradyrhizobium elkanii]MCW2151119.1 hypothetical protein [Bradyrhizobium elkanii]MCW2374850.1 hypothetical protein [Bradyrhizobium elkanii]